jgi:hypothetical protein
MTQPAPDTIPLPLRLSHLIMGAWRPQVIYVATVLGLPDHLASGRRRPEDLASAVDVPANTVQRLLRALVALELCTEKNAEFELTPLGEYLRADAPDTMRNWALVWGRPSIWTGWGRLLDAVKTGQTAPALLSGKGAFEWMAEDPEGHAIFNASMAELTRRHARAVAGSFDFSGVRSIVDVGGGHGALLAPILAKYPEMKGVVFDLPYCREGARRLAEKAGLTGRLDFVSGDFFESLPPGADAYIVKSVIHDWNDEKSLAILKSCRSAMSERARLLVLEPHAPEHVGTSPYDAMLVASDINMLLMTGGCERTEREYRALIEAAGFKVTNVVPTPAGMKVIEARRE